MATAREVPAPHTRRAIRHRRFAGVGLAVATSLAIVVPGVVGGVGSSASATTTAAVSTRAPAAAAVHHSARNRLPVVRSKKGVQPGFAGERITAFPGAHATGTVRFQLTGADVTKARRVRIRNGRAVFRVPALGTGRYRVRASFRDLRGATSFQVYDSAVTLDVTSFAISRASFDSQYAAQLRGSVRYRSGAATQGYVDVYRDGDTTGGRGGPAYVGFGGVATDGTFDYSTFGQDVAARYPPGQYTFQAFYTPSSSFSDYVASNYIVVTVTD